MQISPCLQNVTLLLKSHHHLCKMDRIIDKKGFPPPNFIQINNTFHSDLLLVAKNSRFFCVHGHTHVTLADMTLIVQLVATG